MAAKTPPPAPPAPSREDQHPGRQDPGRFLAVGGPGADPGHSALRAFGAGMALAFLLIGVPAILLWLAGPLSWPGSLPGVGDLIGSIGTEQLLAVLMVIVWLAWAQFAICVVVEVIAARRGGVLAAPVPFSGPSQRLARTLVASVLVAGTLAISTGSAFAATSGAPHAAPAGQGPSTSSSAVYAPGGVATDSPADPDSRAGDLLNLMQARDKAAGGDGAAAQDGGSAKSGGAAKGGGPAEKGSAGKDSGSASDHTSATKHPAAAKHDTAARDDSGARDDNATTHHAAASDDGTDEAEDDDGDLHGRKVYVVEAPAGRHHDSLWAIAEEHLGDGRRYKEIYNLNDGRPQPDGRTLHLARLIQPGWKLIMPEDATGIPRYVARNPERPASPRRHTSPGDTPASAPDSSQSQAEQSAPAATPSQAEAPTATSQVVPPASATAPRTAAPRTAEPRASAPQSGGGQAGVPQSKATQGGGQAGTPQSSATQGGAGQAGTPQSSESQGAATQKATPGTSAPKVTAAQATAPRFAAPPISAPQPSAGQTNPPEATAPGTGTGTGTPEATAPQAGVPGASTPESSRPATLPPSAAAPAQPGATATEDQIPAATVPGSQASPRETAEPAATSTSTWPGTEILGAGLLGAGLLGALWLVRRRRGGVPPEDDAAEAEVWLRAGADTDRTAVLDRALRTIAGSCERAGTPLPQVYGAVVDNEGIDLLLTVPQRGAPAPWHELGSGSRWRLEMADIGSLAVSGDSAYPLLAAVGRDDQGRDALINLGAAGGPVTVLGSPAMASAVVRALALSLAGNPWSRGIEVLTCDLPETLPAIAAGRLISCTGADDLTAQLEGDGSGPARSGPAQVLTGGPAPGSRPERVAVYGRALAPAVAHRVEDLSRSPRHQDGQLAVLMTGELAAARWRLSVDDTGRLTCQELSLSVTANRLGDGSIERLHSLFVAAAQPAPRIPLTHSSGDRPALAQPLMESDEVAWAQAGARIALLGDVEVRTPSSSPEIDPVRADLAAEVVAYLALHPGGVHPTVLGSAIWPGGVTADVRDETIELVRDWMSTDPDGHHRVRTGHDGRIRLSPQVIIDWDVLKTLLSRARRSTQPSAERDLLVRALSLVRGPVAGGAHAGSYSWLARTGLERQAEDLIVDASDRLSQLSGEERDHVGTAQAAAAGLRVRSDAQVLWRHILRAEHALSGPQRLTTVVEQMKHALDSQGVDMEPQTQALIDHLQAPTGSQPVVDPPEQRSEHNPAS